MKSIKIFVSHRIDIDSFQIPNPIFINILCGAYRPHKDSGLLGDNTGDNISELQPYFSELTVQYWAWKNQDADYYGLCHYRRFLSFSDEKFRSNEQNFVKEPLLYKQTAKKYNLLSGEKIRGFCEKYDCIVSEPSPVQGWNLQNKNNLISNTLDLWLAFGNVCEKDINILHEIIFKHFSDYSEAYNCYFESTEYTGFNCFLMSKDLFFKLCDFQFSVIRYFEKFIDASSYSDENKKRIYGYICEILYGIFIKKIEIEKQHKIYYTQLIMFSNTEKLSFFKSILFFMFPYNSKRRSLLKKLKKLFKFLFVKTDS